MYLSRLGVAVILACLCCHAPVQTRKIQLSSKVLSTLCDHTAKFRETSTLQPPVKRASPDTTVPCGWFGFCNQQGKQEQCETAYKSCDAAGPPKKSKGRGVKEGKRGKTIKTKNRTSPNAKVYYVRVKDESGYSALVELEKDPNLDFWTRPSKRFSAHIKIPDPEETKVLQVFKQHKMESEVMVADLEQATKDDREKRDEHRKQLADKNTEHIQNGTITFEEFSTQQEIYAWVDKIAADNPDVATVSSIGTTSEGREIKMLKFAKGGELEKRPSVFLDAGIHAREWISISTGTFLINELKKLASSSEKTVLDKINVYFVPILNPDGYNFSWTPDKNEEAANRYWRKNRRNVTGDPKCLGVDLNRNFGVEFGGAGTSDDPCSPIYRGPAAFSEPESQAVRDLIMGEKQNGIKWLGYLTFHAYAQKILTQWGYAEEVPEDYDQLKKVGEEAADAIKRVDDKMYEVGGAGNLGGIGAGGSDDWAKADESRGGAGIKYSYTFELRPERDDMTGGGFAIDPKYIIPTGEEIWAGVQTLFQVWIEEEEGGAGGGLSCFCSGTSECTSPAIKKCQLRENACVSLTNKDDGKVIQQDCDKHDKEECATLPGAETETCWCKTNCCNGDKDDDTTCPQATTTTPADV